MTFASAHSTSPRPPNSTSPSSSKPSPRGAASPLAAGPLPLSARELGGTATRPTKQGEGRGTLEGEGGGGGGERGGEGATRLGSESSRLLHELKTKHGLSLAGAASTPAKHEPLFSPLSLSVLDVRRERDVSADHAEIEGAGVGARRGAEGDGGVVEGDEGRQIQVSATAEIKALRPKTLMEALENSSFHAVSKTPRGAGRHTPSDVTGRRRISRSRARGAARVVRMGVFARVCASTRLHARLTQCMLGAAPAKSAHHVASGGVGREHGGDGGAGRASQRLAQAAAEKAAALQARCAHLIGACLHVAQRQRAVARQAESSLQSMTVAVQAQAEEEAARIAQKAKMAQSWALVRLNVGKDFDKVARSPVESDGWLDPTVGGASAMASDFGGGCWSQSLEKHACSWSFCIVMTRVSHAKSGAWCVLLPSSLSRQARVVHCGRDQGPR